MSRRCTVALAVVLGLCSIATAARGEEQEASDADGGVADDQADAEAEEPPELTAVVVGRLPAAGGDESADVVAVPGETLRDSARPTTLEALAQEVPDLYVSSRGVGIHGVAAGASGGMSLRGLGGSPTTQLLVVEDGVPDTQGVFGHPISDAYVPELIDEVGVVRGGDSVLYGSNALGGVLVLRSRVLDHDGLELHNDASYGSFTTLRERASLLFRRDAWDLSTAFSALRTNGHRDGAGGSTIVGQLGVGWSPTSSLRIVLRDRVVHLAGEDPGPATHPNVDHWYDVWRDVLSLGVDWRLRRFTLTGLAFLNLGVHRLYDGFYSEDYQAGANVEGRARLHDSLRLVVGLGGTGVTGSVEDRSANEAFEVESSGELHGYTQLAWHPATPLRFVGGVRGLWSSAHGFIFLYKAGLRLSLPRGLAVRLRVSRNYREPTIRERYLPFPTANPDLRPEFSLNLDLGLSATFGPVELSVSGYRTWAHDLIRYFGSWPTAEVVNIDEVEVFGLEARAGVTGLGPVRVSLGGAWQDVGRHTRQNPAAKVDFAIEAAHRFGRHGLSGALSGEWVRGLYQQDYSRDPIGDVFFLDLAVRYSYRFARGVELEPYVIVRNLTNARYEYIAGYPMPGINALAGLGLSL